jgi:pseudouridine-5'-phosphate glycosidase
MITTMICVEWYLTRYPTKISITDAIRVRLVPYSTHDYPYFYSRTSVFKAIRIRVRIKI